MMGGSNGSKFKLKTRVQARPPTPAAPPPPLDVVGDVPEIHIPDHPNYQPDAHYLNFQTYQHQQVDPNQHETRADTVWCEVCFNVKAHLTEVPPAPMTHVTCYCEVFKNRSTCCVDGFYNLMERLPQISLLLHGQVPNKRGIDLMNATSDGEVLIKREISIAINYQCDRITDKFMQLLKHLTPSNMRIVYI